MRAVIIGTYHNFEVIGEPVFLEGTDEKFIVHTSISQQYAEFVVSHIETGQIIGWGDSIDGAIAHARQRWAEKTPEFLMARLAERREWADKMRAERGAGPTNPPNEMMGGEQ